MKHACKGCGNSCNSWTPDCLVCKERQRSRVKRGSSPFMPVEPIRRAILAYQAERNLTLDDMARYLYDTDRPKRHSRALSELLHRQRSIKFDTADRILCKLGCPWLWYSDPDLRRAYIEAFPDEEVA